MRFLLVFFVIFLYGANVDKKIKTTKKTLIVTKNKISNMNSVLDNIVKKINKAQTYLNNINNQINDLNNQINDLKKSLNNKNSYLKNLESKQNNLILKRDNLERKVIDFISNNYYIQNTNATSQKDLINEEILKVVAKESANKMANISNIYSDIDSQIDKISKTIYNIKNSQKVLQNRKQQLAKLKKQQQKYIQNLQVVKLKYKKQLQQIIANQNRLQNQLSKLNIIRKQELKRQRELAKTRLSKAKNNKIDKVQVKNYGNIYMKSRTTRYRGSKTIPPVRGRIVKKFGAYTDPIYHISLYNDSISIKTKPNTKVRAIFSGRVVYVGNNNDGKMIVIKHNNHLHSIYAKLSRISPFVKKGYRVKKGEIIAKVDKELEFEIAYKTLPINPLDVVNF